MADNSVGSRVVKRLKTIAREVRDVPTAIGTNVWSGFEAQNYGPANERKVKANANRASRNQDRQVVEAINSIVKGRSGSSSDQYDNKGSYVKGKKR
jgi:hypothetical protein